MYKFKFMNLFKAIIISMTFAVIIYSLTACGTKTKADDSRMVIISKEWDGIIAYDRETGVEYWISTGEYNRGHLTVLLNEDGKPLIFERN